MKIRIGRFCAYVIISLMWISLFVTRTQAEGPLRGKTRTARKATAENSSGYSVLYSFCSQSNCTDGASPYAGLIQDSAGNLYGTAGGGGDPNPVCGSNGCGTVFKVDATGQETVLYTFCPASNCTDGATPLSGLFQDAAGNLYGTTYVGGTQDDGILFKVNSTGQETVLHSFCGGCADGASPRATLIQDTAGNLYGTTAWGGTYDYGTVFKLDNTGQETVLYSFCAGGSICTDGRTPTAGLIEDTAGNLYGTTQYGGATGSGTVFKIDNTGQETVLYSFCTVSGCADGANPVAGLIQDAAGNLYGTTTVGGSANSTCYLGSCGTVFKLDTTGHETVLYKFCSVANCADGNYPAAGLVQDPAGNLFGTTEFGGANGISNSGGTIFEVDNAGHYTVLYSFCSAANCTDGEQPQAGLILDAAGNLYGTTAAGGSSSPPICNLGTCGTVFELKASSGIALGGTAVTVAPGATTGNTSTITLTPTGGFTGSVTLTAAITSSPAGAQDLPTFSFGSTSPVSITSTTAGTATLTISTTAASSASLALPAHPRISWYAASGAGLAFGLVFFPGISLRRRSWRTRLGLLAPLAILASTFVACGGSGSGGGGGGGGNPGTTPGTYTVTVTGTSGSTTATGTVTLTVQ